MTELASLTLLAALAAASAVQARAQEGDFPLEFLKATVVGRDAALGVIIHGALGPDGSVYVADLSNHQVICFSPEGNLSWRAGREGDGPGEFRGVYRLAVGSDGKILVFDRRQNRVTVLGPDGAFLDRRPVTAGFAQVDGMAVLKDGNVAVSGVLFFRSQPGSDSAVHVLAQSDFAVLRSFGPLPTVRNPDVLQFWGAGGLSLASNSELLYARRVPYEIYRYTQAGILKQVIRPPFEVRGLPDDAYDIEYEGVSRRVRRKRNADVLRPLLPISLGNGWILGGHSGLDGRYFDLFSPGGEYVGSRPIGADWRQVIGFDAARQLLWMVGEVDLEPVLWQISVKLAWDR